MNWGVTPLSRGEGPPSYSVQVPIFPPESAVLPEMDAGGGVVAFSLEGRDAMLERKDHFYVIRAKGFSTPEEAEAFLRRIVLGLYVLILRQRIGLRFEPRPAAVEVEANRQLRDGFPQAMYGGWEERADGTMTDGGVWPMQTLVYPEHERVVEYKIGWGKVVDPLKTKYLVEAFDAAQDHFDPAGVYGDQRLRLAFALYSAAQAQPNLGVRFINLVTVLETLSRSEASVGPLSSDVVKKLLKRVKDERAKYTQDDPEAAESRRELDRLLSKVGELKRKSITEQMCDYVYATLYSDGGVIDGAGPMKRDASDAVVKEFYAVRGGLVHDGAVASKGDRSGDARFSEARDQLYEMVPRLLLAELGRHAVEGRTRLPATLMQRDYS